MEQKAERTFFYVYLPMCFISAKNSMCIYLENIIKMDFYDVHDLKVYACNTTNVFRTEWNTQWVKGMNAKSTLNV